MIARAAVAAGSTLAVAGAAVALGNAVSVRVADPAPPAAPDDLTVSVLLPMRDEAHRVAPCLAALLAQRGVARLEVLVLDDGSSDGTAEAVHAGAAGDTRVRLLTGAALPAGWLGKAHACAQLAAAATGELLVFVDADVVLAPGALAAAVEIRRRSGLHLVSLMPRQVAVGLAERLVQPLLAWSWLATLAVRPAEASHRPSTAAAIGQFLVVDTGTYAAVGGHAGIRASVVDDLALARAVKRAGRRAGMVVGAPVASCRMYSCWPELRAGHTKWLWAAFGRGGAAAPMAAAGALLLSGTVPALAALGGSRLGLAGYLAGVSGRAVVAARAGSRVWPDALAHPVSSALAAALIADSVRAHRRGTLRWKGRPVSSRPVS